MDTINNISVLRRYMKCKHQWFYFINIRLVHAIIILTVCGSTIAGRDATGCAALDTCTLCADARTCQWSPEQQSCGAAPPDRTRAPTRSCPRLTVTARNKGKVYTITVSAARDDAELMRTLLRGLDHDAACEVEDQRSTVTVHNATAVSCNYTLPHAFQESYKKNQRNPLLIVYFSIVLRAGVRLKFDEARDHYVAVYPHGVLSDGDTPCSVRSDCVTAFWDDGPLQYYCKWCLDNPSCYRKQQEGKCYARDTVKGKRCADDASSVVRVKDSVVGVERVSPSRGPVPAGTAVTVRVRGHRVLSSAYNTTAVTVDGRECRDPSALQDGETIECIAADGGGVDDGPVVAVVTYRWPGLPAVELSSVCTDPPSMEPGQGFAGVASGGTRLTARGRFECASRPRLYVLFDGARLYGAGCAAPAADALVCRAPALPAAAASGARPLSVGFECTFAGRTVDSVVLGASYAPRPDPVFTDFTVDGASDTVTVHGLHADGLSAADLTVRLLPGGVECAVQRVDATSVTCAVARAPGPGGSAADADQLSVAVGANLNQTVSRRRVDAAVPNDRPERLLSGAVVPVGVFSGTVVMLLALLLVVKAAVARFRQRSKKWYMQQLRDITAGMDEEE